MEPANIPKYAVGRATKGGIRKYQMRIIGGQNSIPIGIKTAQRKIFIKSGAYQKLCGCIRPTHIPSAKYKRAEKIAVISGDVPIITMNVKISAPRPIVNGFKCNCYYLI